MSGPVLPVPMLSGGSGSGKALMVIGVLVAIALAVNHATKNPNTPPLPAN